MNRRWIRILWLAAVGVTAIAPAADAAIEVLQAFYRPDRVFPEYGVFWTYTAYRPGATSTPIREGDAICVYVRNSGAGTTTISDVLVNGQSLEGALQGNGATARCRCGTVSVYYTNNQTLIDAGVPVWWHALPKTISPGEVSQVYIYLRYRRASPLTVEVVAAGGNASASVVISDKQVPRVTGANLVEVVNTGYRLSALDGFTIRNGAAWNGAGVYCRNAAPQITNNTISGNAARGNGGGVYLANSMALVSIDSISQNSALGYGGGIACSRGGPEIRRSSIDDNWACLNGCGAYLSGSSQAILVNNRIGLREAESLQQYRGVQRRRRSDGGPQPQSGSGEERLLQQRQL